MTQFSFAIGADVHCRDGRAGVLQHVVVDPHSRRVTDLIVEKGFLQKKDRVIPASVVEKATDENIYLKIHSEDLPSYPEYREVEFTVPAQGWEPNSPYRRSEVQHWANRYGLEGFAGPIIPMVKKRVTKGISAELEAIGRNTPVYNVEGPVGEIDHLLVDQRSGEITHLVMRKGLFNHQFVIPVDWIEEVDDEGVSLRGKHADLKQLRHYSKRAANDTLGEVRARLEDASTNFEHVVSSIKDGVLHLSGLVRNVAARRQAEQIARSVPGVIDVDNRLDTSTAIEARISIALETDPRTHLAVIEVVDEHGVVTLSGEVESVEVRKAAEEIASQQPGIITVINALEVKPHEEIEGWIEPAFVAPYMIPWHAR